MARPRQWPPRVLRHSSGAAFLRVDGRNVYLGFRFADRALPANRAAYLAKVAELEGGRIPEGSRKNPGTSTPHTVAGLILRFWSYAKTHYGARKELANFKPALAVLRATAGDVPAAAFGPRQLKQVQQAMVARGWCRRVVNRMTGRVKTMFRWLESEGLVAPGTWHGLLTVPGLPRGAAPERDEVAPVPEADLLATLPHLHPIVRAAVEVQLWTGARPSEVLGLRAVDLKRDGRLALPGGLVVELGDVWAAVLHEHKTAWRGKRRVLLFGPRAQAALTPVLNRQTGNYLFSPLEASLSWLAAAGRRVNLDHARRPGDRYTPDSYRRAIGRACKRAGVPAWAPGRLRHSAATRLVQEVGWDAARLCLGHADVAMTKVYAVEDLSKAVEAMRRAG